MVAAAESDLRTASWEDQPPPSRERHTGLSYKETRVCQQSTHRAVIEAVHLTATYRHVRGPAGGVNPSVVECEAGRGLGRRRRGRQGIARMRWSCNLRRRRRRRHGRARTRAAEKVILPRATVIAGARFAALPSAAHIGQRARWGGRPRKVGPRTLEAPLQQRSDALGEDVVLRGGLAVHMVEREPSVLADGQRARLRWRRLVRGGRMDGDAQPRLLRALLGHERTHPDGHAYTTRRRRLRCGRLHPVGRRSAVSKFSSRAPPAQPS